MLPDIMNFLGAPGFLPHGLCFLWTPGLLWLYVVSDSVIAIAYYSIPVGLWYLAQKRPDLPFRMMFVLFGAFVIACGTTHIIGIWNIWEPVYWLDGWVKAATATVSIGTAVLMWPLMPKALKLPNPIALQRAQDELNVAYAKLEERVRSRTAELSASMSRLQSEIEARTRAQAELARHAEELKRSNAELEKFAYVASHDLQEPLRIVANFASLLEYRYKDTLDVSAKEYIGYIVDGAERMQQLIEGLLAFSRVDTRGRSMERVAVDTALEGALTNLKASIDESAAVITRDPLPGVNADAGQLVQLFQNLIGNAIKFHSGEPPRVHVGAERVGDHWLISVRDNGIGIDPAHFERIFEVFQRLHGMGRYPGTGIGLAICKKIVERHGGRIWVESREGTGAKLYNAGHRVAPPQRGRRVVDILLVEDNPGDVRLLQEVLVDSAFKAELRVAENGEEALAMLRGNGSHAGARRPDLVLLDLNVPRKNGLEVLEEIRADAALRGIPVVVLTSSTAEDDVSRSRELEADLYLTKPLGLGRMRGIVSAIENFWRERAGATRGG